MFFVGGSRDLTNEIFDADENAKYEGGQAIVDALEGELRSIKSDFAVDGAFEEAPASVFLPTKNVVVKFPPSKRELGLLAAVGEVAPLGIDDKTVVDETKRKCLQLSADKFTFLDFTWVFNKSKNHKLLTEIKDTLCPQAPYIIAQFHKMLVYQKGSFFTPHVDTHRGPGHFGTLVVTLPTTFEGGEFVVRHGGEERVFDFAQKHESSAMEDDEAKGEDEDDDEDDEEETDDELERERAFDAPACKWLAFYTDCEHEVRPVTSGTRVTLTYHLFAAPKLAKPECGPVPSENKFAMALRDALDDEDELAFVLYHQYPPKDLRPEILRGRDRHVWRLLEANYGTDHMYMQSINIVLRGQGYDDEGNESDLEEEFAEFQIDECEPRNPLARKKKGAKKKKKKRAKKQSPNAWDSDEERGTPFGIPVVNLTQFEMWKKGATQYQRDIQATGNEGCYMDCRFFTTALVISNKPYVSSSSKKRKGSASASTSSSAKRKAEKK